MSAFYSLQIEGGGEKAHRSSVVPASRPIAAWTSSLYREVRSGPGAQTGRTKGYFSEPRSETLHFPPIGSHASTGTV
jgi:hypothetical protein